jgi:hypothetical protein
MGIGLAILAGAGAVISCFLMAGLCGWLEK